MDRNNEQVKDFIVNAKLVSRADADAAELESFEKGVGIGAVLLEKGKIADTDLKRIESAVFGVPYVSLLGMTIGKDELSFIPESIARRNNVVAFKKGNGVMEVAATDMSALSAIDFIRKNTGLKILPRLTDSESMAFALGFYRDDLKEKFEDIIKKETNALTAVSLKTASDAGLKKLAENVSVMRVVDTLIRRALLERASDMHVEPMEQSVLVRFRVNGVLRDAASFSLAALPGILARIKFLATLNISEKRLPQDGRFKIDSGDKIVTVRATTLPTGFGEKAVLKFLPESAEGFTLDGLGMHGASLDRLITSLTYGDGLVVVSGPEGSGKTTLLYTILDMLSDPGISIATIENHVEYRLPRVTQVQVDEESGMTAENAFRSVLLQDPDVVMLSDISDEKMAALALNAVASGKMVIASIEAWSAADAISALLDLDMQPSSLAASLRAVVSSRLVRVLGPDKERHKVFGKEFSEIAKHADMRRVLSVMKEEHIVPQGTLWEDIEFYKPKRSAEGDEYGGWTGIYEVMPISPGVRSLIRGGSGGAKVDSQARADGMLSIFEDGITKAVQGITSLEEVSAVFGK